MTIHRKVEPHNWSGMKTHKQRTLMKEARSNKVYSQKCDSAELFSSQMSFELFLLDQKMWFTVWLKQESPCYYLVRI
jgi:hypothetical protein